MVEIISEPNGENVSATKQVIRVLQDQHGWVTMQFSTPS